MHAGGADWFIGEDGSGGLIRCSAEFIARLVDCVEGFVVIQRSGSHFDAESLRRALSDRVGTDSAAIGRITSLRIEMCEQQPLAASSSAVRAALAARDLARLQELLTPCVFQILAEDLDAWIDKLEHACTAKSNLASSAADSVDERTTAADEAAVSDTAGDTEVQQILAKLQAQGELVSRLKASGAVSAVSTALDRLKALKTEFVTLTGREPPRRDGKLSKRARCPKDASDRSTDSAANIDRTNQTAVARVCMHTCTHVWRVCSCMRACVSE